MCVSLSVCVSFFRRLRAAMNAISATTRNSAPTPPTTPPTKAVLSASGDNGAVTMTAVVEFVVVIELEFDDVIGLFGVRSFVVIGDVGVAADDVLVVC